MVKIKCRIKPKFVIIYFKCVKWQNSEIKYGPKTCQLTLDLQQRELSPD